MDPMSALAIVAAVFQLLDLGGRLVAKGAARYRSTKVNSDDVQTLQKELGALSANIRHMCEDSGDGRMAGLLEECEYLAAELQQMFDKTPSRYGVAAKSPHAMKLKLEKMKSVASETMVFSLWEKTQASETREVVFGAQMTELLNAVKDIAKAFQQRDTAIPDHVSDGTRGQQMGTDPDATTWPGPEQAATGPFRELVRLGQAPSFTEIEHHIRDSLAQKDISGPLGQLLWRRDWRMAESEMVASVANATAGQLSTASLCAERRFRFADSAARENAVSNSMVQTYAWIYDRDRSSPEGQPAWSSFPGWLEGQAQPVYWITGKPGSGKSTMMKHILQSPLLKDHLGKWADHRPLLWVNYYAWNAGTTLQKSLQGLKRTILQQALHKFPHLVPKVSPRMWAYSTTLQHPGLELSAHAPALDGWEVEEAFDALLSLTETEISLAIFIDGLDEFDSKPVDVVSLVESLTSATRQLKICVASRPWVEFDDAYREVPKLRMDLYTGTDMATFVTERFRTCRAFSELRALHPTEATELLRDVTEKANGVFIWLKLVVDELVESATEGCGIGALQKVVDSLPSDIEQLYQALWNRTPERNRKRGAVLLQLSCTEFWPLSSVEAWLADDYALGGCVRVQQELPTDLLSSKPAAIPAHKHLRPSLIRKLAAGTRGLLEVTDSGNVDFTHRTVHEWIRQEGTRQQIRSLFGDSQLNMRLLFVELLTLQVSCPALCLGSELDIVMRTLLCASTVPVGGENEIQRLVEALDKFDARCGVMLEEAAKHRRDLFIHVDLPKPPHWSSFSRLGHTGIPKYLPLDQVPSADKFSAFINLAAQFYILPYVVKKAAENPSILQRPATPRQLGIYESAVLGYESFWGQQLVGRSFPPVPLNQRLDTVRFLIEQGLGQSEVFIRWDKPSGNLRGLVLHYMESTARDRGDYYGAVLKLVDSDIANRHRAKMAWRSAKRWFQTRLST